MDAAGCEEQDQADSSGRCPRQRSCAETMPTIDGGDLVSSYDGRRRCPYAANGAPEDASGTAGWRVHDLRRTFRTLASRAGINADVAERCLGHTIGGVRAVYDRHHYQAEMQHAYEAIAALIERIVNPFSVKNVTPLRRVGAHMLGRDVWRIWEQGNGYCEPTEAERAEAVRHWRDFFPTAAGTGNSLIQTERKRKS